MRNLSSEKSQIRFGIVGCGYITEIAHLPAFLRAKRCQLVSLVDLDLNRAQQLSEQFEVPHYSSNIGDFKGRVDAVVIATPPGSHAKLGLDSLNLGFHTLIEKPFVRTVVECDSLIRAAQENKKILAGAMARRFYPSDRYVKQLLSLGVLGELISFKVENGYDYRWPSVSQFILSKESAGGGILMGLGSHILDTLMWWLGDVREASLEFDAYGGIESEVQLDLLMECGLSGSIELSRSRNLANKIVIDGEKGAVILSLNENSVSVSLKGGLTLSGDIKVDSVTSNTTEPFNPFDIYVDQLDDFARSIQMNSCPVADAKTVRKSIEIIEMAYQGASPIRQPWQSPILVNSL